MRYYPENKSASGGDKRLREIEQVVQSYGGQEIPRGFRHDWTRFYLNSVLHNLIKRDWSNLTQDSRYALRYPSHIPRAIAKIILNSLPHQVELWLRQIYVKNP